MEFRDAPITPEEIHDLVGCSNPLVVEVGANNGGHSRMFLRIFPEGTIYCFEPDARCIAKWRTKTLDPRATLFEVAVGSVDGDVTFHISDGREEEGFPEGWDSSGSLLEPTAEIFKRWPWLKFNRTINVPCVRLDTWAEKHSIGGIDFLWADVQGAEADLIEGARDCLSRTRYFYTEYAQTPYYKGQAGLDAIQSLLPDFELVTLWRDDALFKRIDNLPYTN